ncbi:SDR family NAD(P)-dependent oxidoreductase [Pseudomonas silesiensis]|uniref:SDR family NAD(P)-dependent oxidoreductase n=1 Tax=Pseudomonas silesiensis TaxID=1853130 RepID=UPI0034D61529
MQNNDEMKGKVAVVTGGASGIGKGIAQRFIANGMHVVIADVDQAALDKTAEEIGAHPVLTDVSSSASVAALADATLKKFGRVDVVCNNAGVGPMANIAEMSLDDWQWLINVNLWGVIHGIHTFLPLMERNPEGGHLINTASIGGLATMPGLGGYCVTKYGVVALTETLAQELEISGSKVTATVLIPGLVHSNIKNSSRTRPNVPGDAKLMDVDIADNPAVANMRWLEPADVGDFVLEAIRQKSLYAFTHPEMFRLIEKRFDQIKTANATHN